MQSRCLQCCLTALLLTGELVSGFEDLERAESDEALRDPADHRASLLDLVAIVVYIWGEKCVLSTTVRRIENLNHSNDRSIITPRYVIVARYTAARSCGRNAEMMHGLRAQELADTRSQHFSAIRSSTIRRQTGAFQLQFPSLVSIVDHFAQIDHRTVAQLTNERTELMACIALTGRLAALQNFVAGEIENELFVDIVLV